MYDKKKDMKEKVTRMEQHILLPASFFFPQFSASCPCCPSIYPGHNGLWQSRAKPQGKTNSGGHTAHFLFPPVMLLTQGSATLSASLVLHGTSSRHINTQEKLPALLQNMTQK